jgi:hypothetical protein
MDSIKKIVLHDARHSSYDSATSYLKDVLYHGCVSGMVSGLIYYADTRKFFEDHKEEINTILQELINSTGLSIDELFGDKWDKEDPLCLDTYNQNLLAWVGYEETCRAILDEKGIEC